MNEQSQPEKSPESEKFQEAIKPGATVEYVDAKFLALEDTIKQRDNNRLRTAYTLANEFYDLVTKGKPVSRGAWQGFVFSMLNSQKIVVAGSIIGGIVLLAQTYLMYKQYGIAEAQRLIMAEQTAFLGAQTDAIKQQTKLLEQQTQAMNLAYYSSMKFLLTENSIFIENSGTAYAKIFSVGCVFGRSILQDGVVFETNGMTINTFCMGARGLTLFPGNKTKLATFAGYTGSARIREISIRVSFRGPFDTQNKHVLLDLDDVRKQ